MKGEEGGRQSLVFRARGLEGEWGFVYNSRGRLENCKNTSGVEARRESREGLSFIERGY